MTNELLWILLMLVDFSLALLAFRLFGRDGLYALIAANIII
ncbi:VUT family protein, partial [Candidatus Woesearchaeota archaeon]